MFTDATSQFESDPNLHSHALGAVGSDSNCAGIHSYSQRQRRNSNLTPSLGYPDGVFMTNGRV